MTARTTLILTCALALGGAHAHDFVLSPAISEGSGVTVTGRYGHPGSWETVDPYRLIALDAYPPGSAQPTSLLAEVEPSALKLVASSGDLDAPAGTWIVAATYDNGYWVKLADGKYYSTTKKMAPTGTSVELASHNIKFSKALVQTADSPKGFDRVVGHKLEIVPTTMAADKVTVRVLFDGQPLAGAGVGSYEMMAGIDEDKPLYQTGADGTVEIPLGNTGLQLLRVDHDTEAAEPDLADRDNYSATLVFATR